jgi:hypothetical protein
MPTTKEHLIRLKTLMIDARSKGQECAALARRLGDKNLADRLRDVVERLAFELDYVERLLAALP